MRKAFDNQMRLDVESVLDVELNFECRDEIVPILRALQYVYGNRELLTKIMALIQQDVNADSSGDSGRNGMDYWHIMVFAAVRLGSNLDYDKLQDHAESHLRLRGIMGIGSWTEKKDDFNWRRIRDNLCLLKPSTIKQISELIVSAGHELVPDAIKRIRGDSSVIETQIHYPTESSIISDGLRKIIDQCMDLAATHGLPGWRQGEYLKQQIKRLARTVGRIATKKGRNYHARLRNAYSPLLAMARMLVARARLTCADSGLPAPCEDDLFGSKNTLQAFIVRTERVIHTATRRVVHGETVPNADKLFSVFEPHTQLYRRGKAGEPIQLGRLTLFYEDAVGFIVHHHVMARDQSDKDVIVAQTKWVQEHFGGLVEDLSLDRGFHSPNIQDELDAMIPHLCLPKPGEKQSAEQMADATDRFHEAQKRHPGVESAIGALQRGNGLKRCRDRSETGFERYVALGVLGRNIHTLGKILIQEEAAKTEAAKSKRKRA